MRKLLLLIAFILPLTVLAQPGLTTFETPALPTADTYYVNYTAPGSDVGLDYFVTHFPCVYDTGFGAKFLSSGFVYSNVHDSVTSGFGNQYAAKAMLGYNGSQQYLVSYGTSNIVRPAGLGWRLGVNSFFITNSTYAYNSMRDGDAFSKKFGGVTGNDSDWFKLTIRGYKNGSLINDSMDYYLADFRSANNSQDYIVKDWEFVSIKSTLRFADSLQFNLSSSDNGSFGMNTPAYFCLDNWSIMTEAVEGLPFETLASLYPNPAANYLKLDIKDLSIKSSSIIDLTGRTIATMPVGVQHIDINISLLPPGQYLLRLEGSKGNATTRFIKQ